VRVVLVDRDGTTSFAAAGALLAQDPNRSIRALLGGLQAFYAATQFGGQHGASHEQPAAQAVPATPASEPQTPAPQKKAKKRSAGC
jgi:hypothetical protein